jgi:hypothetical protein
VVGNRVVSTQEAISRTTLPVDSLYFYPNSIAQRRAAMVLISTREAQWMIKRDLQLVARHGLSLLTMATRWPAQCSFSPISSATVAR